MKLLSLIIQFIIINALPIIDVNQGSRIELMRQHDHLKRKIVDGRKILRWKSFSNFLKITEPHDLKFIKDVAFLSSAMFGDVDLARQLISEMNGTYQQTALDLAFKHNQPQVVNLLLDHSISLYDAIIKSIKAENNAMFEMLIKKGNNFNKREINNLLNIALQNNNNQISEYLIAEHLIRGFPIHETVFDPAIEMENLELLKKIYSGFYRDGTLFFLPDSIFYYGYMMIKCAQLDKDDLFMKLLPLLAAEPISTIDLQKILDETLLVATCHPGRETFVKCLFLASQSFYRKRGAYFKAKTIYAAFINALRINDKCVIEIIREYNNEVAVDKVPTHRLLESIGHGPFRLSTGYSV